MSEAHRRRRSGGDDAGITLVEVLIGVLFLGIIVTSLSALVTVVMRQEAGTGRRYDVARATQTLGMWLPTDLASAEEIDASAGASPCGGSCPISIANAGSNAVMITWRTLEQPGLPPVIGTTNVSYRYVADGANYKVVRVKCARSGTAAWSCSSSTVLRDAMPPAAGSTFVPGTTAPTWVMWVTDPPMAADNSTDPVLDAGRPKNARRVMVTVNSGGAETSFTGGFAQLAISAGSTDRRARQNPESVQGTPTFSQVRSRCGGNFGVIYDMSNSIGSARDTVKAGVSELVDAFAGTPIRLQVVAFNNVSWSVGGTWGRWFDMLNDADIATLKQGIGQSELNFGTNWEDSMFRMFLNHDGTPQATLPDTLLFFTDGVPTYDRLQIGPFTGVPSNSGAPDTLLTPAKNPVLPGAGYPFQRNVWVFVQEAWDRTNYIANTYRDAPTRFIGVGVGPDFAVNGTPITYPTSQWSSVVNGSIVQTTVENRVILARLVSGTDTGVPAVLENGKYMNTDTANMYSLPNWNQFTQALQAVALGKCGGTLTVQTVMNGQPVGDEFTYQTTSIIDSAAASQSGGLTTVTTSSEFPSGTFDFSIPRGDYVDVTMVPTDLSSIAGYKPVGWTCRARGSNRSFGSVAVPDSLWTGISLRVSVNEAMSCRLEVAPA